MQTKVFNTNAQYKSDPNASNLFTDLNLGSHTISAVDLIVTLFGHNKEELDFEASCVCGHLEGNFFTEPTECPKCKSKVKTQFCDELSFRGWIDIEGILGTPVLHPVAYSWLSGWMGNIKKVPIIDMLLDVDAELPEELSELKQGYNYFYNNFWKIIEFFENTKSKRKPVSIRPHLSLLGDDVFVSKLPILNGALHIMTHYGKMRLADNTSKSIVSALTELSDVVYKNSTSIVKDSYIDSRLWSIYKLYLQYTKDVAKTKIYQKGGINRKHLLGGRLHLTFRAVITPITVQHSMDELHLPWKIGVTGLKLEILNILTKRMKYSMEDAVRIHAEAIVSYDQRVSDALDILIDESPFRTMTGKKGLFVLFGRNPVLQYLSIMAFVVTTIKKEVNDETIGVSTTVAKYPNLDFDGDELFGLFIKEVDEARLFENLKPYNGVADKQKGGISDMLRSPQPITHHLNAFIRSDVCDARWLSLRSVETDGVSK